MTDTLCNRCRLNMARDEARENGLHLSVIPETKEGKWDRGLGIYVHPLSDRWDSDPKFKVAWLASAPDICICGGLK